MIQAYESMTQNRPRYYKHRIWYAYIFVSLALSTFKWCQCWLPRDLHLDQTECMLLHETHLVWNRLMSEIFSACTFIVSDVNNVVCCSCRLYPYNGCLPRCFLILLLLLRCWLQILLKTAIISTVTAKFLCPKAILRLRVSHLCLWPHEVHVNSQVVTRSIKIRPLIWAPTFCTFC